MPDISRRASSLGTENAFVVLAEVNALARQGKDIISFCIGQPDFPAPQNVQEAAIRAIKGGKHGYTPSAGIDELREAAARYMACMRGGLPIRAEDVVVGAGAKPFIAYAVLSTTDYGAGDEVIYPNPGFPIYESQIVANGPQDAAEKMKKSFLERRDFIVKLLNEVPGVTCQVPGGAFYVWPNVTEACRLIGAADSEEFRKRLLAEAGVAVLADIHFGARVPGEGQHVRFSYAASKQAIEAGVQRMADFIRKNTRKAA